MAIGEAYFVVFDLNCCAMRPELEAAVDDVAVMVDAVGWANVDLCRCFCKMPRSFRPVLKVKSCCFFFFNKIRVG